VRGIAVHIGARIAGLADGGEVLMSRAVRDLVAGSGLSFESRGVRSLNQFPMSGEVFAAIPAGERQPAS
jgi:class 3 adenylate cyclase